MSTSRDGRLHTAAIEDRSFFGHPRGLSTLFFTEFWERFSYYGIRPLLVLFMSAALADGGFGIERSQASAIVGIYAAGVYLASLPGGWVADRLLGLRRAVMLGAVLISLGHISIGVSSFAHSRAPFFVGLVLIVLGTGLLKPNISAMVGDLYPEGGARRDAGFSIFYMGINSGAVFGQLFTGLLGEKLGGTGDSALPAWECWSVSRGLRSVLDAISEISVSTSHEILIQLSRRVRNE